MLAFLTFQGVSGCPRLSFRGLGERAGGRWLLRLGDLDSASAAVERQVEVTNSGDATAFVKVQSYLDGEAGVPDRDGVLTVTPSETLVGPSETVTLRLSVSGFRHMSRGDTLVGGLAVFHGPEVARQVMLKARACPNAGRFSAGSKLLGLDFTGPFGGGRSASAAFEGTVIAQDVKIFEEKTEREMGRSFK